MEDILSQDEINALIESYKTTGGAEITQKAPDKQVRFYDFARPDKFSKEHLRSLNLIHSKHGVAFAAALATMMRTAVQVDLLALDQLTYREYCASVPDGTLFVEVSLDPLTSTAVFEFNPSLVSACVDLQAGGTIVTNCVSPEVTEIDKVIITPVVELALRKYVESWSGCIMLKPKINLVTTDSNNRQTLLPSEAVLVCGYEVKIGDNVSMMSICIPAAAIEAVLPALAVGRTLNSPQRRYDRADDGLKKTFDLVEVECRAVLGRTELSLGEVVDLEVGDLVRLPTKSDGQVEFWVENVAAFAGVVGVSSGNLAVKVTGAVAEPETEE